MSVIPDGLSPGDADRVFRALGDATRRDILARTVLEKQSVTELARRYDMSHTAVQKHVAVLERAGLIVRHARGRERVVRADRERIRSASRVLRNLGGCRNRDEIGLNPM
ncbi:metalloregulator ArsR/SmtB family transcription factor [Microbacterium sp. UBA3486]|uniref:ArsR/SmtB family transcription factor n=1 Tax=Microbacterium TaxID=33882 RepID=UPI00296FE272|nr:metalloregulator ArsR/SmtB family transcription factor [Microbacterium liquefaciens]